MFKFSFLSIGHVVARNYMSFKNLFKISIVPNLIDPLFYLLAMGFGVGAYLTHVNGMLYRDFVITGLIAATAMSAATAETTVNTFIQYKIEKTYDAMLLTPINTSDIVVGQAIWAGIRAVIFGGIFWLISILITAHFHPLMLLIPLILFIVGYLFGVLSLIFTYLAPSREFLNYYNVLVIRPLYMFSDTFFPIASLPELLRHLTWFSPLYHTTSMIRLIWSGEVAGLSFHLMWLMGLALFLTLIPIYMLHRAYYK